MSSTGVTGDDWQEEYDAMLSSRQSSTANTNVPNNNDSRVTRQQQQQQQQQQLQQQLRRPSRVRLHFRAPRLSRGGNVNNVGGSFPSGVSINDHQQQQPYQQQQRQHGAASAFMGDLNSPEVPVNVTRQPNHAIPINNETQYHSSATNNGNGNANDDSDGNAHAETAGEGAGPAYPQSFSFQFPVGGTSGVVPIQRIPNTNHTLHWSTSASRNNTSNTSAAINDATNNTDSVNSGGSHQQSQTRQQEGQATIRLVHNRRHPTNALPPGVALPLHMPLQFHHLSGRGRMIPSALPPLEPQPLPQTATRSTSAAANAREEERTLEEKEAMKLFECAICFEYMDDPAGCGNCDARFCRSCIHRAAMESIRNRQQSEANDDSGNDSKPLPKCPCCRKCITCPHQIKSDHKLKARIESSQISAICPYPNCNQKIFLAQIKEHEANCAYMPMRCKYASFGCKWTGPKKDLEAHNKVGCVHAKVGGMIDQFRQFRLDTSHTIVSLQQQLAAINHIQREQGQTFMALQTKNFTLLEILHLTYFALCHPSKFLLEKPIWRPFYGNATVRASVNNFLFLLPTILWVLRIYVIGTHKMFAMISGALVLVNESMGNELVLDDIFLSCSLFALSVLFLTCFFVDDNTSTNWQDFPIVQRRQITRPVIRDSAACAIVAMHFVAIEFDSDGSLKGLVVWFTCAIGTAFLPPIIESMLLTAADGTLDPSKLKNGRASAIVEFGLKYGLLISLCQFTSIIDGILILQCMVRFKIIPNSFIHEESEVFLKDITKNLILLRSIIVVRMSILAATKNFNVSYGTELLIVCALLIFLNCFFNKLQHVGEALGSKIAKNALAESRNSSDSSIGKRNCHGPICFCVWVLLVGNILIA